MLRRAEEMRRPQRGKLPLAGKEIHTRRLKRVIRAQRAPETSHQRPLEVSINHKEHAVQTAHRLTETYPGNTQLCSSAAGTRAVNLIRFSSLYRIVQRKPDKMLLFRVQRESSNT